MTLSRRAALRLSLRAPYGARNHDFINVPGFSVSADLKRCDRIDGNQVGADEIARAGTSSGSGRDRARGARPPHFAPSVPVCSQDGIGFLSHAQAACQRGSRVMAYRFQNNAPSAIAITSQELPQCPSVNPKSISLRL